MSEIVKGVLGGGTALIAGWILPVALNLLLFQLLVRPDPGGFWLAGAGASSGAARAAVLLGAAVVGGLVLNMLQTPLYRLLEGYLGWPQWAFDARRRRHRDRRAKIASRLAVIRQFRGELAVTEPGEDEAARRARLRRIVGREPYASMPPRDRRRSAPQRALLREELRRYPVDDDQILPTALGNAIRRFEEYGWNRYRLDSQALWTRLITAAPEPARKQVDNAQIGVDFFVSLLYGHAAVAILAVIAAVIGGPDPGSLLVAAALPVALIPVWYRLAVVTTDQWAASVQALVDLGRQPLATALGLALPASLERERVMWEQVSRFVRREFDPDSSELLDEFRADPGGAPQP